MSFFYPIVPLDPFSIYLYVQLFPEYDLQAFLTPYTQLQTPEVDGVIAVDKSQIANSLSCFSPR